MMNWQEIIIGGNSTGSKARQAFISVRQNHLAFSAEAFKLIPENKSWVTLQAGTLKGKATKIKLTFHDTQVPNSIFLSSSSGYKAAICSTWLINTYFSANGTRSGRYPVEALDETSLVIDLKPLKQVAA